MYTSISMSQLDCSRYCNYSPEMQNIPTLSLNVAKRADNNLKGPLSCIMSGGRIVGIRLSPAHCHVSKRNGNIWPFKGVSCWNEAKGTKLNSLVI